MCVVSCIQRYIAQVKQNAPAVRTKKCFKFDISIIHTKLKVQLFIKGSIKKYGYLFT